MQTPDKMPLLFSKDEVHAIGLIIKKYFQDEDDVQTGKVVYPKIDEKELECLLADDTTFYIDSAMLKDIASRITAIKEVRSVNLVYLSMTEIANIHAANWCVHSSTYDQAIQGQESPSLEDRREHDLRWALAIRLEKICDENKK
jgi:hypothetical protein